MSRSNPDKRKPHTAETFMLVYGEGRSEEVFIRHLKGLYCRSSGVSVVVRNGKGGTPKNIVSLASRFPGTYHRRVAIVDNDKGQREMEDAKREAKGLGVEVVAHTPCLEALLLEILNPGVSYAEKSSPWCKKEFERLHIAKKQRGDLRRYKRLFPRGLLDERREKVAALDSLIRLLSGDRPI